MVESVQRCPHEGAPDFDVLSHAVTSQVVLGLDPDLSCTGIAVVSDLEVFRVTAVKVKTQRDPLLAAMCMVRALPPVLDVMLKGVTAVVIEGQQIYTGTSKARPEDILQIACVSGAAAGIAHMINPDLSIFVPTPARWKKQVPKKISQARAYAHYDWKFEQTNSYSYPSGCARVARGERLPPDEQERLEARR